MSDMSDVLLSIGHGYSARALAGRLVPAGWRVIGTTRSADKTAALAEDGVTPLIWPGRDLPLGAATHLLSSVGPGPDGDPVLRAAGAQIAQARHLRWIGYLSTTSVYGDHGGAWVDEDTPPDPATDRGRARLDAERAWARVAEAAGVPLHIFRLGGIYGPGRGPFAKLRAGRAQLIIKPGQMFSRIHVDDIAQALAASMRAPVPGGRVYNLCDDLPAPPQDVLAHAAQLLGIAPPEAVAFEDADLSPMGRSFYAENKRVRNHRMRRELGIALRHPDYRSGLASILEHDA